MTNLCKSTHRYEDKLNTLPLDQGGVGRHRCCGCAFELGFRQGTQRSESFDMNLDSLPISQAGTGRHKSPHAAFALGYQVGVEQSYN